MPGATSSAVNGLTTPAAIPLRADGRPGWPALLLWLAVCLTAGTPLLLPQIPPLTDVPGHMGSYQVMLAIGHTPSLAADFQFHWRLIGNLGVDLLIVPLAKLLGVEFAVKLITLAIPPVTVAGLLWLAREVHGRVPPTALFALPLAYSYPFELGFLNFALALGLAFNAAALWMWLGRAGRVRVRAAAFALFSFVIWLAHAVGWGILGLIVLGAEFARLRQDGETWAKALARAVWACAPLATPVLAMGLNHSAPRAPSPGGWSLVEKLSAVASILRDRWLVWDVTSALATFGVIVAGVRSRRLCVSPLLAWPATLCAAAFVALPPNLGGASYLDMRIVPAAVALAVIGVEVRPWCRSEEAPLRVLGLAYFALRMAAATLSLALFNASFQDELHAVDALPENSSALVLVERPCTHGWRTPRLDHLGGMAIVRRNAFANDQWGIPGLQLVGVRKAGAGAFAADPSQHVYAGSCAKHVFRQFDEVVDAFNRQAFDYVWTIGFPVGRAHARDLAVVWSNRNSALYKVTRIASPT